MLKNTAFAALFALVSDKTNAIRIDQKSLAEEDLQAMVTAEAGLELK